MNGEPQRNVAVPFAVRLVALALTFGVSLWGVQGMAMAKEVEKNLPETLVPMGQAVGMKLFSDGVIVVGLSDVAGQGPAEDCGLKQGDIITHINSVQVDTIEQVRDVLQDLEGDQMSIRASRGQKQVQFTAQAVETDDGTYKLGAWIRDSMAGIGTMTFYDPESGQFGALGHSINDMDTALLMPLESGSIMPATVEHVRKGVSGSPGELQGSFEVETDLGELYLNSNQGVFGTMDDDAMVLTHEPIPVASAEEIQVGPATILSNIDGKHVQEFQIEITKKCNPVGNDTRDMMIKVTDQDLIDATGGIVQGMSGSPIIQNGKIIGAVTHVLVNDPTTGYGIFIEHMLETAG